MKPPAPILQAVLLAILSAVPAAAQSAFDIAQEAYIKASNAQGSELGGDWFGWSAAISGDTMVVGAPFEGSNARGVNGEQVNNQARGAGAAYAFTRVGSTWIQQAYLKASNTETADVFGSAVGVSRQTLVVGAAFESSGATGVNANQADNSAIMAGAMYAFRLKQPEPPEPALGPITGLTLGTGGIELTLPAPPGSIIRIEHSESLAPDTWLDLGPVAIEDGIGRFLDADPQRRGRPQGYYRAVRNP